MVRKQSKNNDNLVSILPERRFATAFWPLFGVGKVYGGDNGAATAGETKNNLDYGDKY